MVQLEQNIERPDSKTPLVESQIWMGQYEFKFYKNIWINLLKEVSTLNM